MREKSTEQRKKAERVGLAELAESAAEVGKFEWAEKARKSEMRLAAAAAVVEGKRPAEEETQSGIGTETDSDPQKVTNHQNLPKSNSLPIAHSRGVKINEKKK